MSIAGIAVTTQHRHRVPGDPGVTAALDDNSTGRIVIVDIGLAIANVEIPLESARSRKGVVLAVVRYTASTEDFHRVDSLNCSS